ncbi:MAG: imidazoleglycerol-phosphate dehydratase HisB [bacterium]|nr:imidazoleglycerol-phosphate dehydratase HisB [bacterium]
MTQRTATISRQTTETKINLSLNLDGTGEYHIDIGVPFLEHMLNLFAKHGLFDLTVQAQGDIDVDAHHTVDDIGICLGKAFAQALGDKAGIKRFGSVQLPMDEVLAAVSVDISGRAYLVFNVPKLKGKVGEFDVELAEEFFRAFVTNAGITLHIDLIRGENLHHIIEGIFKAVAKALSIAVSRDERVKGIPSTKGVI